MCHVNVSCEKCVMCHVKNNRAGAAVVSAITSRKCSTRNVFSHLLRVNNYFWKFWCMADSECPPSHQPPGNQTIFTPCFFFISKQVIITCTWILGVIFNIPSFIYRRYNEEQKYCINTWPSVWVGKAYSLSWLLLAVLSTSLMAVLYFRVAYTMWFKKEEHRRESTLRQRVRWPKT